MAIQGTFTADFSSFSAAVDNAVIQLRGFEASTAKVESALTRMTDNFSGRKIITDATLMAQAVENVGGVSHLTEAELAKVGATASEAAAKLRAMGQDVPPQIQHLADTVKDVGTAARSSTGLLGGLASQLAGMFTIGAVIAFGKEVLEAGDKIQKMADQTGLSTDEVQRLQYVAGQSGTSIESLVGAVQNLQQRLGDENTGAAGAMAKLGINADAFNKLGTYEQMTTLSAAVQGIQSPTEQASVAAALFGKTWKEILPAIKSGMKETGDQATIMSNAGVKALDWWGDTLKAASGIAIAWSGTTLAALGDVGAGIANFLTFFNPEHFGTTTAGLLEIEGELNRLPAIITQADVAAKQLGLSMPAMVPPGLPKDLDAIIAKSNDLKAGIDADVEALKKWHAAVAEVTGSLTGWQTTLDTIDGSVVEGIKLYLSAGASQEKLATMYGLTAQQIKAVVIALEEEAQALGSSADFEAAAGARRLEITKAMTAANNDLIVVELRRKQAEGEASENFLLAALKDAQAQDALNQTVKVLPPEVRKIAPALDDQAAAFESFKGIVVAGTGVMMNSLQGLIDQGRSGVTGFQTLGEAARGYLPDATTIARRAALGLRAEGGPVVAGGTYLVGEKGPELYTAGASGFITPGGGGTTVHVGGITVNGSVLSSQDALARAVGDALLTRLRGMGLRLPSGA